MKVLQGAGALRLTVRQPVSAKSRHAGHAALHSAPVAMSLAGLAALPTLLQRFFGFVEASADTVGELVQVRWVGLGWGWSEQGWRHQRHVHGSSCHFTCCGSKPSLCVVFTMRRLANPSTCHLG